MKPNKTLFGAFVISVTLIIGACQQTELSDSAPTPSLPAPAAEFVADDSDLSAGDAAAVARIFRNGNRPTRAGSGAVVRNVVTIRDAAGRPAIYAVNLQEGYLLVSATKRCYPILAQIDRGTFTLDREPSGLDVVLQEMTETIEAARDSAAVFDCRSAWLPYEERTRLERMQTRALSDEFYAMQDEWFQKWSDEGCKTRVLSREPDDFDSLPIDVYEHFVHVATDDDAWADTEYNCMNTAIITEKYHDSGQMKGPFLTTKWGQRNGYNALFENKDQPLGCVTIAVGQLMRYYQHPAYFNWSDMPDETSNPTLSSFLALLHGELRVTDSGSSNIDHAKRVLESYGYSCSKRGHDASTVYTMLNSNLPVYTQGQDKPRDVGHAWVIDGTNTITAYTEFKLYVLNNAAAPKFQYIEAASERIYHTQNVFFHMNWGQYGLYNGWFLDNRISFKNNKNEICNYSSDRKDLLITDF